MKATIKYNNGRQSEFSIHEILPFGKMTNKKGVITECVDVEPSFIMNANGLSYKIRGAFLYEIEFKYKHEEEQFKNLIDIYHII